MFSSAVAGQPPSASRVASAPAFITAPRVRAGSWQCCMKTRPVARTVRSTRPITPASATQSPSSVKAAAPARARPAIGASRPPSRPWVAQAAAKTRALRAAWPWWCTCRTRPSVSMGGRVLGMQQTLVKPPLAAAAQPVAIVSRCSGSGSRRCTCRSMSPGVTMHPSASILRAPRAAGTRPISVTTPSVISTSAVWLNPLAGSITRPPWMSKSVMAFDCTGAQKKHPSPGGDG